MKTLTLKKLAAASAIALAIMTAPAANAGALLNNILQTGGNTLQDTNADRFLRASTTGSITLGGTSYRILDATDNLQQGDIIQSILRFETVNSVTVGDNPGFGAPYGVLAYSELVVGAITTAAGVDFYNVSASGNLGANVLVSVYENGVAAGDTQSLISLFTGTAANGISEVTDAGLIATFGLQEADDFWQVRTPTGPLSTLLGALGENSPQAGTYEFGLSVLSNPGALAIADNAKTSTAPGHIGSTHDVIGNGSGFAPQTNMNTNPLNDGWQLETNTTVRFNTVPEPELLGLLSVGLLAGGVARRRRNVYSAL